MKKSLLVLCAAALALMFVGCNKPTDEPGNSDPTPPVDTLQDFIAFEGSETITTVAGAEKGYNNFLVFDAVVDKAYKTVEVTYEWESETGTQCQAQLMAEDSKQSSATMSSTLQKTSSTQSAACFAGAEYDDYSTGSAVKTPCATTAAKLQVFIQDKSYQPAAGTITITKVVFKA